MFSSIGQFHPWDYAENTEVIATNWDGRLIKLKASPPEINEHGEKIECFMQGTRDYIKFLKRGYSRVAQINAFHVRGGRMSSEKAFEMNAEFDGRKPHHWRFFGAVDWEEELTNSCRWLFPRMNQILRMSLQNKHGILHGIAKIIAKP